MATLGQMTTTLQDHEDRLVGQGQALDSCCRKGQSGLEAHDIGVELHDEAPVDDRQGQGRGFDVEAR